MAKVYSYSIVDVFTNTPLQGNPVAVFKNADGLDARSMQALAKELNLSETTFIFPSEADADATIRIFTPVNELKFAGHPILGTAFVLAGKLQSNTLRIKTKMGTVPLEIQFDENKMVKHAAMQQPIPTWDLYHKEDIVLKALNLTESSLPIEIYHNGPHHVFVGIPNSKQLADLKPDHNLLSCLKDVAINCFAPVSTHRWRMRMFSPAYGVIEDAATGSAAGPLAIHLCRYGLHEYGSWINIEQGVEMGRNSLMRAIAIGSDDQISKVVVAGEALIVANGCFEI